jgi:hypothetical protein
MVVLWRRLLDRVNALQSEMVRGDSCVPLTRSAVTGTSDANRKVFGKALGL